MTLSAISETVTTPYQPDQAPPRVKITQPQLLENDASPGKTLINRTITHTSPALTKLNNLAGLLKEVGSHKTDELSAFIDRMRTVEKQNHKGIANFTEAKSVFSNLCIKLIKFTLQEPSWKEILFDHLVKNHPLNSDCPLLREMDTLCKNNVGMTINEMLHKIKQQPFDNIQGTESPMAYLAGSKKVLPEAKKKHSTPENTRHHDHRCGSNTGISVTGASIGVAGFIIINLPGTTGFDAFCCNGSQSERLQNTDLCNSVNDCENGADENCTMPFGRRNIERPTPPDNNCFKQECSAWRYDARCCIPNHPNSELGYFLDWSDLCNGIEDCTDGYDENPVYCEQATRGDARVFYHPYNCFSWTCKNTNAKESSNTTTTPVPSSTSSSNTTTTPVPPSTSSSNTTTTPVPPSTPSSNTTTTSPPSSCLPCIPAAVTVWPYILAGAALATTVWATVSYCVSLAKNKNVRREKGICSWLATPPKLLFAHCCKSPCALVSKEKTAGQAHFYTNEHSIMTFDRPLLPARIRMPRPQGPEILATETFSRDQQALANEIRVQIENICQQLSLMEKRQSTESQGSDSLQPLVTSLTDSITTFRGQLNEQNPMWARVQSDLVSPSTTDTTSELVRNDLQKLFLMLPLCEKNPDLLSAIRSLMEVMNNALQEFQILGKSSGSDETEPLRQSAERNSDPIALTEPQLTHAQLTEIKTTHKQLISLSKQCSVLEKYRATDQLEGDDCDAMQPAITLLMKTMQDLLHQSQLQAPERAGRMKVQPTSIQQVHKALPDLLAFIHTASQISPEISAAVSSLRNNMDSVLNLSMNGARRYLTQQSMRLSEGLQHLEQHRDMPNSKGFEAAGNEVSDALDKVIDVVNDMLNTANSQNMSKDEIMEFITFASSAIIIPEKQTLQALLPKWNLRKSIEALGVLMKALSGFFNEGRTIALKYHQPYPENPPQEFQNIVEQYNKIKDLIALFEGFIDHARIHENLFWLSQKERMKKE